MTLSDCGPGSSTSIALKLRTCRPESPPTRCDQGLGGADLAAR